ncbi:protein FAM47E [Lingula anatina]|uniref:Protein FAM47E n=1 Tax=Lingula anatina TaxID=7574 RepID=A0A1S3IVV8_LINAN|nr:protein FAM47E [Lingula anatina]|eukprot:XP_013402325.1 protein FAM47E [Lingula anatina]
MAENKYDLLLVKTLTDKKIREKPWYKERIYTKYIKSLKPTDTSKMLIGKDWMFIKDGLDDFRDGLPPQVDDGDIMIKSSKGPAPNLMGSEHSTPVKQPAQRRRFNKYEVCYSRVTPQMQKRREHIDEIEYGLTQHPLALYPHLEECMPPELFEEVVDILDPEMNVDPGDESDDSESEKSESMDQKVDEEPQNEQEEMEDDRIRNPYRWLPRKEEKEKKDKKKQTDKRPSSPSQDEHIKTVTKDFCDWVAGLGGESNKNNIEESTITSLFASGYETKPALSVPIHVVELTNVPPELRQSAAVPLTQQQNNKNLPTAEQVKKDWIHSGNYEPSWVPHKYGAWYLPTKLWQKRPVDEPLQDPKALKDLEKSETKKKSNEKDHELAPLHGSKAFMDFIDRKKVVRKPEFLIHVAEIQRKAAEEEAAKLSAEQNKSRRHNTAISTPSTR